METGMSGYMSTRITAEFLIATTLTTRNGIVYW